MIPTTHDTLQKVDSILNGRQSNYADPIINFDRIAKMWSVILDRPVSMTEVAMCMVALKICREVAVSQPDNADDTVGYGACWARVSAYEREQAKEAYDREEAAHNPANGGGPMEPGNAYAVGEPGPEVFTKASEGREIRVTFEGLKIDRDAQYMAYDKPVENRWGDRIKLTHVDNVPDLVETLQRAIDNE